MNNTHVINTHFLKAMFMGQDDTFWGIEIHEDEGYSEFTGLGYSGVQCTGYAVRIQESLGADRVKVMGFSIEDNAQAGIGSICDGHDFAVVDGRYIVDPWLVEVETGNITTHKGTSLSLDGQGVFDMEDADDQIKVAFIYGDKECWTDMSAPEATKPDDPHFIEVEITATIRASIHTDRGESVEDFCKWWANIELCESIHDDHGKTTWLGSDKVEIKVIEVKK